MIPQIGALLFVRNVPDPLRLSNDLGFVDARVWAAGDGPGRVKHPTAGFSVVLCDYESSDQISPLLERSIVQLLGKPLLRDLSADSAEATLVVGVLWHDFLPEITVSASDLSALTLLGVSLSIDFVAVEDD